ncbi:hypothetical protein KUTeg_014766 [Tegillarca granosa]|uniref:C-type lectin domain-containing protein n=1 Tax=Tegillarca granosa TaxID=220873 RepID=A0ABQ9ERB7_TEGGR|nr:hypothetical protein KUTeg_014766 [Tegillarca granosa]
MFAKQMLAKMDGCTSMENSPTRCTDHTNCYKKGSRLADVKSMDELNIIRKRKWIWSYNNEPIKWTYWYTGEPNGKRSENCLIITKYRGDKWKWNDSDCKNSYHFVCQKKMQTQLEKQCLSTKDLLDELIKCKQRCKCYIQNISKHGYSQQTLSAVVIPYDMQKILMKFDKDTTFLMQLPLNKIACFGNKYTFVSDKFFWYILPGSKSFVFRQGLHFQNLTNCFGKNISIINPIQNHDKTATTIK